MWPAGVTAEDVMDLSEKITHTITRQVVRDRHGGLLDLLRLLQPIGYGGVLPDLPVADITLEEFACLEHSDKALVAQWHMMWNQEDASRYYALSDDQTCCTVTVDRSSPLVSHLRKVEIPASIQAVVDIESD